MCSYMLGYRVRLPFHLLQVLWLQVPMDGGGGFLNSTQSSVGGLGHIPKYWECGFETPPSEEGDE